MEAKERRGNARLQLRSELRREAFGLESGIARRFRSERIEVRCEMAVHPDRLDERHRSGDPAEELLVSRDRSGRGRRRRLWRCDRRSRVAVSIGGELEQTHEARLAA